MPSFWPRATFLLFPQREAAIFLSITRQRRICEKEKGEPLAKERKIMQEMQNLGYLAPSLPRRRSLKENRPKECFRLGLFRWPPGLGADSWCRTELPVLSRNGCRISFSVLKPPPSALFKAISAKEVEDGDRRHKKNGFSPLGKNTIFSIARENKEESSPPAADTGFAAKVFALPGASPIVTDVLSLRKYRARRKKACTPAVRRLSQAVFFQPVREGLAAHAQTFRGPRKVAFRLVQRCDDLLLFLIPDFI